MKNVFGLLNISSKFRVICVRPKKNNCVIRVTAEKTIGRVGRYFFFFFFFFLRWPTCWMTKRTAF